MSSAPRHRAVGLLLSCLMAAVAAPAQLPDHPRVGQAPTPDWVRRIDVDPGSDPGGTEPDVSYLLVDYQVRAPRRGETEEFHRHAYRIESRGALEDWSSWEASFDPVYQQLRVHTLRVYRGGAWQDRLATSRADVLHREDERERQIFDHRLDLLLVLDDVRVGDVVDIAYSLRGDNPVFGGRLFDSLYLGWSRPIRRLHRRYLADARRELRFRVHGAAAEPARTEAAGWVETVWDLRDVEVPEAEPDTPASFDTYPWLEVSEHGTWGEVVRWALPLYGEPAAEHAEAAAAAARIRDATADPAGRIAAARDWVQGEIRYFAVPMGEHSHAPHRLADILRHRYGDCKDKSLLLVHLLRRLDIEAWPAFVSAGNRGGIAGQLPSPGVFDHAIVAARAGGQTLWIDPTLTLQGGAGDDLYVPPYQLALEIRPGVEALSPLPEAQSLPGTSRSTYDYEISTDELLSEVTITQQLDRYYAEDLRRTLAGTAPDELLESYIDFYTEDAFLVEPTAELEIADDRGANRVTVIERYRLTYQPSGEDDGVLFAALPLLMETDLSTPEAGERRAPFALPHPLHREETVILQADGWSFEPVDEQEENPWFRFGIESTAFDGGIHLRYELETLADEVPAAEVETYRAAVERMQSALGYVIWDAAEDLRGFALLVLFCGALATGVVYSLFFFVLWHQDLLGALSDG